MQRLRASTRGQEFQLFALGDLSGVIYPRDWSSQTWKEFLHVAKQSSVSILPKVRAVLVFLPGRTLTVMERKELTEALPPPTTNDPMRQAVLTNNLLIRGTMTAISWLMRKPNYELRAFPITNHLSALEWLQGVGHFDLIEALVELKQGIIASRQDVRILQKLA